MPKKSKKGKKGKKGGKKAGGGKKGKKDAGVKSMALANSKMWEARLEVAERSRAEYRENARRLLLENDILNSNMHQTEKDTIDVITFLKKQDQDKEGQMERIVTQMKDQKKDHRKETEKIVADYQQQTAELEQQLAQKSHEVEIMQSELKQVKEFRRKRAQMQRELEEIKEAMFSANREHKETLHRMEQKFFEEKMRLQQEANQKIAELAERAHTEAIANLDETTRSVYKENVRVNEALSYHMEEGQKLKKLRDKLEKENEELLAEKEMNTMVIQEKVQAVKTQKHLIKQLQEKVETLEKSLSHVMKEFDKEKHSISDKAKLENNTATIEIAKLQRTVDLKTKEMAKVKKLAKNILDQRTEMERFFLEALETVKQEIAANRSQYRKDAQFAYQRKMLEAHTGKADFPRIRTFTKSDHSTNSVFKDLEAAERLAASAGKVDISELTWEQKEKVLRFLFGKINGTQKEKGRTSAPPSMQNDQLAIEQGEPKDAWHDSSDDSARDGNSVTFLTQAPLGMEHSMPRFPQINQMNNNLIEGEA